MNGWAAVLFDLDGTLADTVDLIVHCYRHMMEAHGHEAIDDELWLSTIGRPFRDQLREFVDDEVEADRMAKTYAAYQNTVHDRMVKPFPGALDTVQALKDAGSLVAVVTSKRRRTAERTLGCCGLNGVSDLLVCVDDVTRGKPDPEPVLLALERLGLSDGPERVLFVGDAPYDIQSGRAAGTRTAAVEWGSYSRAVLSEAGPDYWLGSLRDTLELRP